MYNEGHKSYAKLIYKYIVISLKFGYILLSLKGYFTR